MEGRCLWIQPDDVDGPMDEGHVVKATHPLSDWCLRGDDGSEPVAPGTLLEIVETRPWGAAMAQEIPALNAVETGEAGEGAAIMQAMVELEAVGLWEFVSETSPEVQPDGDIAPVRRLTGLRS